MPHTSTAVQVCIWPQCASGQPSHLGNQRVRYSHFQCVVHVWHMPHSKCRGCYHDSHRGPSFTVFLILKPSSPTERAEHTAHHPLSTARHRTAAAPPALQAAAGRPPAGSAGAGTALPPPAPPPRPSPPPRPGARGLIRQSGSGTATRGAPQEVSCDSSAAFTHFHTLFTLSGQSEGGRLSEEHFWSGLGGGGRGSPEVVVWTYCQRRYVY